METIKTANRILKKGIALLPDDAKGDFKTAMGDLFIDEAINNALGMVDGNEEKTALLKAYAVQEANRIVGTLWREELLPANLEKEYRELPKLKEVADAYNVFTSDRKARMEDILKEHKAIEEEEKEMDIFKGVINGLSKKESEYKYAQYANPQKAA